MHQRYWINEQSLWTGETLDVAPFALIDLNRAGDVPADITLPPFPVIGFGNTSHPLAEMLDAVAQTAVQLAAIAVQVTANPCAAAVLVQLLRTLPAMTVSTALAAESQAYGQLQASAEHQLWLSAQAILGSESSDGLVRLEHDAGRLEIILDRPLAGNAINRAMRDQLREAFDLAVIDDSIRHIHLSAEGRTFSLGAELSEFGTTRDPIEAQRIRSLTLPAHAIARCADRLSVHVQGGCVGAGLEMAAFARRITASADAWFQLPELAMGVIPGAGGCVSLTRRIGRQPTALMVLTGRRFSARQALAWGLIDTITGDEGGAYVRG